MQANYMVEYELAVMEGKGMWTTVYVATGKDWASEIEERLKDEGFIVKLKYFGSEGDGELYEVLVPKFEAEDVQSFMLEFGIL